MDSEGLFPRISYRTPKPEDIEECYAIEIASYPSDEAATRDRLRYRQSQASEYFQCAFLDDKEIIGFVCATRCIEFEETSMSTHAPTGRLLAIHSVVLKEEYRRKRIATAMLKTYLRNIRECNVDGSLQSIVLLSKAYLLGFYVHCGFQVIRVSPIVHGQEQWYELELSMA
jgi:ribosomal protein S18 acetylase RimI-like enzyme